MTCAPVPADSPEVATAEPSHGLVDEDTEGSHAEARALGPDADLVLEVVARDKYHCETVEMISLLEAMGGGLP